MITEREVSLKPTRIAHTSNSPKAEFCHAGGADFDPLKNDLGLVMDGADELDGEQADGDDELEDDGLQVRELARSSGSELSESGDWQVVEEKNIAVDYSNVRVFLETLQAW